MTAFEAYSSSLTNFRSVVGVVGVALPPPPPTREEDDEKVRLRYWDHADYVPKLKDICEYNK